MFDLEDLDGIMPCILWPEQFADVRRTWSKPTRSWRSAAAIDRRPGSEETNLIVNELIPLERLASPRHEGNCSACSRGIAWRRGAEQLRKLITEFPGNAELQLLLNFADGTRLYIRSDSLQVELNTELRERIERLLGPGNFRAITASDRRQPPRPDYSTRAMATST